MKLSEEEAALGVSIQCSSFAQFEKSCTGFLGVLAKLRMMSKFHSEKSSVIELDKSTKYSRMPTISK